MLAEDAVFYSPAVFTPQCGREKAAAYLRAAEKLFSGNNFRYVGKWFDTHSAVLEFTAELDGLTVEGIDMIQWNDEDKIMSVKVMIRPLKALQALFPRWASFCSPHDGADVCDDICDQSYPCGGLLGTVKSANEPTGVKSMSPSMKAAAHVGRLAHWRWP